MHVLVVKFMLLNQGRAKDWLWVHAYFIWSKLCFCISVCLHVSPHTHVSKQTLR